MFRASLGWEVLDSDRPAIALWTTYSVRESFLQTTYALGGVMELSVLSGPAGVQYLGPGDFIGPVVLEQLGPER